MSETTGQSPPEVVFKPMPAQVAPPPSNGHRKRKKWQPWHYVAIGVGIPFIVFFFVVGIYITAHRLFSGPVPHPAATAHRTPTPSPTPTKPRYNLAGYSSTVSGPEERAFAAALWALRRDMSKQDYEAEKTDAPKLIAAANGWLSLLSQTNPPPPYQAGRASYIKAAKQARQAGQITDKGLPIRDLVRLQRGVDLAARAQLNLLHPSGKVPTGG